MNPSTTGCSTDHRADRDRIPLGRDQLADHAGNENWATTGPGYHIYYSNRRQLPTGLRLLVELIREVQPLGLWIAHKRNHCCSMSPQHSLPPKAGGGEKRAIATIFWRSLRNYSSAPEI